jgi:Mn-dependent DtxR family transcriptional regulator
MSKATKTIQTTRLFDFLASRDEVTTKEISKTLKIANPSAVVHNLRTEGVRIYTNKRRTASGKRVFKYRLA